MRTAKSNNTFHCIHIAIIYAMHFSINQAI